MSGARTLFCDAFLAAVYGAAPDHATVTLAQAQPGFAVYRNTIFKACVDALAANFPAVERLTGPEWFRSAATAYAQGTPPRSASLLEYGAGFPAFLAAAPSAAECPYLAGVAHLEWAWLGSHTAADEPVLTAATLASLAPDRLGALVLTPHASARWMWWPDMPVVSIWAANRSASTPPAPARWTGEGALLTRRAGQVVWSAIGPGTAAFLDACAAGMPLAAAAQAAVAAEATLELAPMLSALLAADAFKSDLDSEELTC